MNENSENVIEDIQRMIVKTLATNPEGRNLHLIGGYRFRLFDNSPRISKDIDYHSSEDLEEKRNKVISLFKQKLLPQVKEKFRYDGSVAPAQGPDSDTPLVKTINLAFYIKDFAYSRIEIPVDILTIETLDEPIPRTADGVVFLTRTDQDIIESKVIAVLNSTFVRGRDIVDIFLFEDKLAPDSAERIAKKLTHLGMDSFMITKQIQRLIDAGKVHTRGISEIIETQLDPQAADNINRGGGANAVFDHVMTILTDKLNLRANNQS